MSNSIKAIVGVQCVSPVSLAINELNWREKTGWNEGKEKNVIWQNIYVLWGGKELPRERETFFHVIKGSDEAEGREHT